MTYSYNVSTNLGSGTKDGTIQLIGGGETQLTQTHVTEALRTHGEEVHTLKVDNSFTTVGPKTFHQQNTLLRILFASDSKVQSIGDEAFSECTLLQDVDIPPDLLPATTVFLTGLDTIRSLKLQRALWDSNRVTLLPNKDGIQQVVTFFSDPDVYTVTKSETTGENLLVKSLGLTFDIITSQLMGTYNGSLVINTTEGGEMTQTHVDQAIQAHTDQEGPHRVLHTLTAGKDFTALGSPLSLQSTSIRSLLFPEGNKMTKIGQYALAIDETMNDIKLPRWVTEDGPWSRIV
jgi:hypothetical protein